MAAMTMAACATTPRSEATFAPASCQRGLSGSFVQLSGREFFAAPASPDHDVALLRSLGLETLIVQFTGDERGPFDTQFPHTTPVQRLLRAATAAGVSVWLGLHADPTWPHAFAPATRLPPPLDDPARTQTLVQMCAGTAACAGFYLSPEIDDSRGLTDADRVRDFVLRTSRALRGLAPDKRLAMAPFFTGRLTPEEHATFWQPVVGEGLVDVFMLQDGVGTGRATPRTARRYLEALRPVMAVGRRPVELWSVVELFEQLAGPPHDDLPFAARSASFDVVAGSLRKEGAVADRLIAFSVLDYMDPRRDGRAAHLYDDYRQWCQRRPVGTPASSESPSSQTAGAVTP